MKTLKVRGEARNIKVKFRQKDGTVYEASLSSRPIIYRGESGSIEALIHVTERKEAIKALRESEERNRLISELSSDFAYAIRFFPDGSHVHEWETRALESIIGYSEPELSARGGLGSIVLPDRLETFKTRGKQIRAGDMHRGEFHLRARDGAERWVYMDREYMAGSLADFLTPSSLERALEVYQEELAIEEGLASQGRQRKNLTRPRTFELEMYRSDGKTWWAEFITGFIRDEKGQPIGILGVTRDITDRKRAEDALKESELRYRILFQNAPIGICLFSPYGQFLRANEELLRLSGYSEVELRQTKFRDFLQNPADLDMVRKKLREEGAIRNYEIGAKRKDGRPYYASLTLTPVTLGGEDLIFVVLLDITEARWIAKEKQKLEEQLQRAQKMEASGTLAGGVAHDLNNILSGITSYPELLLMDLPEDSRLRRPLQTIQSSGQKAAAIVQDLLTLARRGVRVSDVVNLNDVIIGYLHSPEYAKLKSYHPHIQVKTDLEIDLTNIVGSSVHLSKTVMNLVSNAVEAMEGQGEVVISTANQNIAKPLKGYDQIKKGEYATVSVSDTGSGIPGKDIEKIFEPFYTKKVMGRSGTGLGMAVAQSLGAELYIRKPYTLEKIGMAIRSQLDH